MTSALLPRRQEIINLLIETPLSSFDSIARQFPLVSPSSIHFDLQQLQKQGFIQKHGVTRATVYSAII